MVIGGNKFPAWLVKKEGEAVNNMQACHWVEFLAGKGRNKAKAILIHK
jgi:hypothetical protein